MRRSRRGRAHQTPANDRPRLRPLHFLLRPSRAPAMKPLLIIGLGNPLMGDDGVGALLAESLAGRADADVLIGGTDLLRCAGEIEGRQRVILIDAVQCEAESDVPGEITVTDEDPPEGLSSGRPPAARGSGPRASSGVTGARRQERRECAFQTIVLLEDLRR